MESYKFIHSGRVFARESTSDVFLPRQKSDLNSITPTRQGRIDRASELVDLKLGELQRELDLLTAAKTDWYGNYDSEYVSWEGASETQKTLQELLDQQVEWENVFDDDSAITRHGLPPCKRVSDDE